MADTNGRRWRYLEDNRAVTDPGWLPPAEDAPELADLRTTHQRLLRELVDVQGQAVDLVRQRERQIEAREAALRQAYVDGTDPELPNVSISQEDVAEVQAELAVIRDALQQFAVQAVQTIREAAPEMLARQDEQVRQAQEKRQEARRLLEEAERLDAEPARMRDWLARATGESNLGLYPYEHMPLPMAVPVPALFEELAGLQPATAVGVGSDSLTEAEMEVIRNA